MQGIPEESSPIVTSVINKSFRTFERDCNPGSNDTPVDDNEL
jgi:hypothetical protein